jgi:hypothetical protein
MGIKLCRRTAARLIGGLCVQAAVLCVLAVGASSASADPGSLVHIFKPGSKANANQSTNWFGYNQGSSEQGGKQFHSVAADWTVPTATSHTKGQDEASSTWTGIGGGCVDASCTQTDNTLIQTGTEQDVDSSGNPSYSAWWEIIPLPSMTIDSLQVSPGDHMHADITETPTGSENWQITLKDVTRGQSFTTTVPYPSSYATAEWIQETPVEIGSSGAGVAALPNLSKSPFDFAATNGSPAGLKSSEEMQLVESSGGSLGGLLGGGSTKVIGAPSAPDSDFDGFNVCAWQTTCSVPSS